MRTRLTDMFGIDIPIFAFSHCRDVVVEVSRAGGMGVLGAGTFTPERLEEELAWIDARVGDKPYGVDILMPNSSIPVDPRRKQINASPSPEHKAFLDALCEEAGVAALPAGEAEALIAEQLGHIQLTLTESRKLLEVAYRHPIKLIVNALGAPPKDVVEEAHGRGIKVGSLIGKVDHIRAQIDVGVDLVVAQGTEAGGHTGPVTSMILWPQVVDASPVPVLAAGGIGNGRQMAAALAMGAEGIWCGSIWLAAAQSEVDPLVRERFYSARSEDAVQSRSMSGKPLRMLRSKYSDAWDRPGAPATMPMPLQSLITTEARLRLSRGRAGEWMSYPVGQIVGSMTGETSVREIVRTMMEELVDSFDHLSDVMQS